VSRKGSRETIMVYQTPDPQAQKIRATGGYRPSRSSEPLGSQSMYRINRSFDCSRKLMNDYSPLRGLPSLDGCRLPGRDLT
jgi:hypothetical protein